MTYHLRGWWRWLWLAVIGTIILMSIYMAVILWTLVSGLTLAAGERRIVFGLASLIVVMTLGLAGFMGLIFQQTFVRLSDHSISYVQPGLKLYASWQDVHHIGKVPFGRLRVMGLVLNQATLSGCLLLVWIARRTQQDKVIPLTPFMADWHRELASYSAHHNLVEQADS